MFAYNRTYEKSSISIRHRHWARPSTSPAQSQRLEKTTSERFHLSTVGYVMLGVGNIKTASEFYRDRLGLEITRQTNDVVFFDAGTISLVISTAVRHDPGATKVVFSVDHVQPAYEALSHAGLTFERKPHQITDSSWAANFRDPDGHILSLFGPK